MTKKKNAATLVVSLILTAIVVACCGFFCFKRERSGEICQSITLELTNELSLAPIQKSGISAKAVRLADGMIMVYIEAGDFIMGLEEGKPYHGDEKPAHTVYLDSYWIDQTEVTNSQYRKCVEAGVCTEPYYNDNVITNFIFKNDITRMRNDYFYNSTLAQHPVVWVRWEQAQTYCQWAGGRLPTEAEWEKAARGTDGRDYSWGNDFFGDRVNYCDINGECKIPDSDWDDGYQNTAPAGSYPDGASPYGVLDMAGNVSEWVADLYQYDYYGISPGKNPTGPDCAEERIVRGGNFADSPANVCTTYRNDISPKSHSSGIGFRCAVTEVGQLESTAAD